MVVLSYRLFIGAWNDTQFLVDRPDRAADIRKIHPVRERGHERKRAAQGQRGRRAGWTPD